MKIAIFGATGSVGRHLVDQALIQEHEVIAVARNPDKLEFTHPNLTRVSCDVFNADCVDDAIIGADAVLITLGSPKLTGKIRSMGTKHIVLAMEKQGIARLICQTTLGMGDSYENLNFFWKYIMFGLVLRMVFNDHRLQEDIVRSSHLDWTIVRPSSFTDAPESGSYKQGFAPEERSLSLTISRADTAAFMLQQLTHSQYLHQAPGISN